MRTDCYFCFNKTLQSLIAKFNPSDAVAEDFVFSVHKTLEESWGDSNPLIATKIHKIAKEKLKVGDLYPYEKKHANEVLLKDFKYWENLIINAEEPFGAAVKLAVTGNIIDYGAHCVAGNIKKQITAFFNSPLRVDMCGDLWEAVQKAKSILYLGDNAGEIVFDRILIETMRHPNVTFVTRGAPVINDITLDDVRQVGIGKVCKVITNGFDAPSTLLEHCSEEFKEVYNKADLVISKGQGNFEGLMDKGHPNTFFLLIAKCKTMADLLGCDKNDMVVTKLVK